MNNINTFRADMFLDDGTECVYCMPDVFYICGPLSTTKDCQRCQGTGLTPIPLKEVRLDG